MHDIKNASIEFVKYVEIFSQSDKPSIFCGYKSNTGYLYPLERGFLYVPRPPIHLRFDEIAHVNFARGTGTLRSFDFEVTSKQEQVSGQKVDC